MINTQNVNIIIQPCDVMDRSFEKKRRQIDRPSDG